MNREYLNVIGALLNRYDYAGVQELMNRLQMKSNVVDKLLLSCEHSLNFDFKGAHMAILELNAVLRSDKVLEQLKDNLFELVQGLPDAIFSELVENTKIQLYNGRYIDFLSRVYRFKEAILKYIFIKKHVGKTKFSFMSGVVSKKMILKILRKKYKIYNSNLSFAITAYIDKYLAKDKKYQEVLDILNAKKMDEIIELRHASIAGHGFQGINRNILSSIYGNPYHIIDDFCRALELLDIKIYDDKYDKLNEYLFKEIETNFL